MAKLPVLKPREVVALLVGLGFTMVRQRGSHMQFRHADGRGTPCVLIQAVEIDGFKMGAWVSLPDRAHHLATVDEFELLGTQPPG